MSCTPFISLERLFILRMGYVSASYFSNSPIAVLISADIRVCFACFTCSTTMLISSVAISTIWKNA
ncbi:hypothetical protein EDD15DRAFT_2263993 [Pisolithus albus]|nr:hypothetical protein EDD15DRAFT_2302167 [Pisolithus albus]KAI5994004.1 hypothetical protein EDD15DRAFT_2263993 [Pisolithus albus]